MDNKSESTLAQPLDDIKLKVTPLPADPADQSALETKIDTVHAVPAPDSSDNVRVSDSVGNKTDAASDGVNASLHARIKDVRANLGGGGGSTAKSMLKKIVPKLISGNVSPVVGDINAAHVFHDMTWDRFPFQDSVSIMASISRAKCDSNGDLWAIDWWGGQSPMGYRQAPLYKINKTTGVKTQYNCPIPIAPPFALGLWRDMDIDSISGRIFIASDTYENPMIGPPVLANGFVVVFDPATSTFTLLTKNAVTNYGDVVSVLIDKNGNLVVNEANGINPPTSWVSNTLSVREIIHVQSIADNGAGGIICTCTSTKNLANGHLIYCDFKSVYTPGYYAISNVGPFSFEIVAIPYVSSVGTVCFGMPIQTAVSGNAPIQRMAVDSLNQIWFVQGWSNYGVRKCSNLPLMTITSYLKNVQTSMPPPVPPNSTGGEVWGVAGQYTSHGSGGGAQCAVGGIDVDENDNIWFTMQGHPQQGGTRRMRIVGVMTQAGVCRHIDMGDFFNTAWTGTGNTPSQPPSYPGEMGCLNALVRDKANGRTFIAVSEHGPNWVAPLGYPSNPIQTGMLVINDDDGPQGIGEDLIEFYTNPGGASIYGPDGTDATSICIGPTGTIWMINHTMPFTAPYPVDQNGNPLMPYMATYAWAHRIVLPNFPGTGNQVILTPTVGKKLVVLGLFVSKGLECFTGVQVLFPTSKKFVTSMPRLTTSKALYPIPASCYVEGAVNESLVVHGCGLWNSGSNNALGPKSNYNFILVYTEV